MAHAHTFNIGFKPPARLAGLARPGLLHFARIFQCTRVPCQTVPYYFPYTRTVLVW